MMSQKARSTPNDKAALERAVDKFRKAKAAAMAPLLDDLQKTTKIRDRDALIQVIRKAEDIYLEASILGDPKALIGLNANLKKLDAAVKGLITAFASQKFSTEEVWTLLAYNMGGGDDVPGALDHDVAWLHSLPENLSSLRHAIKRSKQSTGRRPIPAYLYRVVFSLAKSWTDLSGQPFTQAWHTEQLVASAATATARKGKIRTATSPGATFVSTIVRFLNAGDVPHLPTVTKRVVETLIAEQTAP